MSGGLQSSGLSSNLGALSDLVPAPSQLSFLPLQQCLLPRQQQFKRLGMST